MSHNMNDPRDPWSRLTAAVREIPDDRDTSAPYGFATRIAAMAFAQETRLVSLFERFAFRAVGVAALLALFSVVLNYQALSNGGNSAAGHADDGELTPKDDAVAIVLDLAD